jgi:hypothetical protein
MQIIDIDTDPTITKIDDTTVHIFAGHVSQIIGVDYIDPNNKSNGNSYRGKELVNNTEKLKTVWINHSCSNAEFSIKIGNTEIIKKFIEDYKDMILNGHQYFVVCNDVVYKSNNPQYKYKIFLPIDSIDEYNEEFKMWKIN